MKKIWLVGASGILLVSVLLACSANDNLEQQKLQAEASRSLGEAYLREGNYTAALKELLKLGPDSQILLINSEGNTDPDYFRRVVWDGVQSVPQAYRWEAGKSL